MNCNNCGTANPGNARFCCECGDVLSGNGNYQSNQTYVMNPTIGKKKIMLGIVISIMGFLLIIGKSNQSTSLSTFGALILIVGIIVIIVGKVQHWYHWK